MHHHLTADDKALILALRVQKCWIVDKMILEFPKKTVEKTKIVLLGAKNRSN